MRFTWKRGKHDIAEYAIKFLFWLRIYVATTSHQDLFTFIRTCFHW